MSHVLSRVLRRAYRSLPSRARSRLRDLRDNRAYSANTRGVVANESMRRWFREHGRPVSIVIPSYNDIPLLTEALESIERTCAGSDYEVIIVDDYIDPVVAGQLKQFESDRVRVILKDRRLGFSGTVNTGMAQGRHDIVLLNSDIVAQDGWLEALQYSAYAIDPAIGMVSPMLVYPNGRIQYGGSYYARLLAPQWFGHLHVGAPATKPAANVAGYNRAISGACVYITREAFDRVGYLDDGYWLGFEDVDYGLRAWDAGVRCFYQPAAMLVHHESASRGYSQGRRELASMRRFWRRWEKRFLARTIDDSAPVDFVVGRGADDIWTAYATGLADGLRRKGSHVEVHELTATGVDDDLVRRLESRPGTIVACDWTAAETAWLGSLRGSVPVYLLPCIESMCHPTDPALQARIIAGYRSEFDYVAPTRWTQRQLQAETAWEATRRISPALTPEPLPEESSRTVVTVGADPALRARVDAVAGARHYAVLHKPPVRSTADLADIAGETPRVIVSAEEFLSPVVPYALMASGAVLISPTNAHLGHDVLDGYNALLHEPGDVAALERSIVDAIEHDDVWLELRSNGHASAARAASAAVDEFDAAIRAFRASSVN